MIRKRELRVLSALDSPKGRQELADELDYRANTVSDVLNDLDRRELIHKERTGNRLTSSTWLNSSC